MNRLLQKWASNGSALLLVAGLMVLGAYSLLRAPEAEFSETADVKFPRYNKETLATKRAQRPYLKKPTTPVSATPQNDTSNTEPDPVLRGLRAIPDSNGLMVLEANAIKHSWIFEALEGCIDFQKTDLPEGFPEDFDIMESVDRVATGDGVALVSGFFEGVDWEAAIGDPIDESDGAKIFEASEGQYFAIWDDQMMITADSREQLDDVLRGLSDPSSIPTGGGLDANDAFGDIYGKLNGLVLKNLVPEEYQEQLTPELLESLEGVDFHVDTSQGLAMSAQVHSDNEETLKALNFVMKLALSQAQSSAIDLADEDVAVDALGLAQALKASQIGTAEDGTLNFDLALPRQVMESFLVEACSQIQAEETLAEEDLEEALGPEGSEDED